MQSYTKVYMDHFGYDVSDFIPCELDLQELGCQGKAVDIHHIRGRGAGLTNEISNLIAVCRSCHDIAHSSSELTAKIQEIHDAILRKHNEQ